MVDISGIDGLAKLFFSEKRHPYYIVAPPYKRASAGVVTQHIFCHLLNRLGYPAYLIIHPNVRGIFGYARYTVNPRLVTPLLTPDVLFAHYCEGLTPITLYPETIPGNPMHAPVVARHVLYYSGKFGGDRVFAPGEYIVAFSEAIKATLPRSDATVSFPIADPRDWLEGRSTGPRTKKYYYGEKFIHTFGGKIPEHIAHSATRITRDKPDSLTRPELIKALQSADLLYVFEDTAMIYEALLAGCIPVVMKNKHFTGLLGERENGLNGIALSDSAEDIARARATIGEYPKDYARWMERGIEQLNYFAVNTQLRAQATPYPKPMPALWGITSRWYVSRWVPDAVSMKIIGAWRMLTVIPIALRMHGARGLSKKIIKRLSKYLRA